MVGVDYYRPAAQWLENEDWWSIQIVETEIWFEKEANIFLSTSEVHRNN